MVSTLLTFGKFKMLALIDLDWAMEMEAVCPVNKLGAVTVYQTSRHGAFDGAGSPALLGAIHPQVAIFNNGPRKGLGQLDATARSTTPPGKKQRRTNETGMLGSRSFPGIGDIWQGHLWLLDKDPSHNTSEKMIANLEDHAGLQRSWIKASVEPSRGKFTITNGRNGFSKIYTAR